MNLNNVIYYMWGYREVPIPTSGGGSSKSGVSDICCLNFDQSTGKLSLTYEKDGKKETLTTTINVQAVTDAVTDISSMRLDKNNNLILSFYKNGVKHDASVNLDTLEDDIFIEGI